MCSKYIYITQTKTETDKRIKFKKITKQGMVGFFVLFSVILFLVCKTPAYCFWCGGVWVHGFFVCLVGWLVWCFLFGVVFVFSSIFCLLLCVCVFFFLFFFGGGTRHKHPIHFTNGEFRQWRSFIFMNERERKHPLDIKFSQLMWAG